jgi:hypothetical protein
VWRSCVSPLPSTRNSSSSLGAGPSALASAEAHAPPAPDRLRLRDWGRLNARGAERLRRCAAQTHRVVHAGYCRPCAPNTHGRARAMESGDPKRSDWFGPEQNTRAAPGSPSLRSGRALPKRHARSRMAPCASDDDSYVESPLSVSARKVRRVTLFSLLSRAHITMIPLSTILRECETRVGSPARRLSRPIRGTSPITTAMLYCAYPSLSPASDGRGASRRDFEDTDALARERPIVRGDQQHRLSREMPQA